MDLNGSFSTRAKETKHIRAKFHTILDYCRDECRRYTSHDARRGVALRLDTGARDLPIKKSYRSRQCLPAPDGGTASASHRLQHRNHPFAVPPLQESPDPDLDPYRYEPMPSPTHSRLLKIQRTSAGEANGRSMEVNSPEHCLVRCSLDVIDMKSKPAYIALSYTWTGPLAALPLARNLVQTSLDLNVVFRLAVMVGY